MDEASEQEGNKNRRKSISQKAVPIFLVGCKENVFRLQDEERDRRMLQGKPNFARRPWVRYHECLDVYEDRLGNCTEQLISKDEEIC